MIATKPKPAALDPLQALESEKQLLSSMFMADAVADEALSNLSTSDFTEKTHQVLFEAFKTYFAKNPTFINERFLKQLKASGDLDLIGFPYLGEIVDSGVSVAHVKYHIQEIRRASCMRAFKTAGRELLSAVESADHEEAPEIIAARMEQILYDATSRSVKPATITSAKEMTMQALERIDIRCKHGVGEGLQTGFTELDKMTSGLHKGQLVVLAARTSCGKSVLAGNLARNVSGNGQPVFFISLEMSQEELAERLLLSEAKINSYRLRQGWVSADERGRLVEASSAVSRLPLLVDDSPSRTVHQIASAARMVKRKHGLGLLIVDYMQLIEPENNRDSRVEQVGKISRRLKTLARELAVPIVALAQLNRQADSPKEKPRLSHLRECGAIEQDADVVLFVHRAGEAATGMPADIEDVSLIVAKQRNGPVGELTLRFFRQYTRFENAAEKWQERQEGETF